jgi:hypothetical protein
MSQLKHTASMRKSQRKAWDHGNTVEAQRRIRDVATRVGRKAAGISGSVLEGLDDILAVNRLRLPPGGSARSPAPTPSRTRKARAAMKPDYLPGIDLDRFPSIDDF